MTTTSTSNGNGSSAEPRNLNKEPLPFLPNQSERWVDFPGSGATFFEAAELIHQAAKEDGERSDLGVGDLSTWRFGPDPETGVASIATIPLPGRPQHMIPLRDHAFGQLCGRINAPAAYLKKLPGKLQMACVGHGMNLCTDTAATLRLAGGEARALLSDRYAALDNGLILEVLETTLKGAGMLGDVRVRSVALGPTCSMRLTLPGEDKAIAKSRQVGDIVELGLDILNGEIGNRAVSICPITYRLVCLNGMRRADREVSHRLRHVGDPKRLIEAFQDAVPAALASARGLREQMEKATDRLIDDLLNEFDSLRTFGLSVTDTRDVAADMLAERSLALPADTNEWGNVFAQVRDVSAYDVINGITHVAQRKGTDARIEMEEAASKYLQRAVA